MYKIQLSLDAKQLEWLSRSLKLMEEQTKDEMVYTLHTLISTAQRVCELNDEAARAQAAVHTLQYPSLMAKKAGA
jgi:hypothetical protein